MNLFFILAILLSIFVIVPLVLYRYLEHKVLVWLGAHKAPQDALWTNVKETLVAIASNERVIAPSLLVLPEFAPNAMILPGTKPVILLTEGLVRTLSEEEIKIVFTICLARFNHYRIPIFSKLPILFFPLLQIVLTWPKPVQIIVLSFFSSVFKVIVKNKGVLKADQYAASQWGPTKVRLVLQKLAVLSRKLNLNRWTLAMDHFYLVSPILLEVDSFWIMSSQPDIEDRGALLQG